LRMIKIKDYKNFPKFKVLLKVANGNKYSKVKVAGDYKINKFYNFY